MKGKQMKNIKTLSIFFFAAALIYIGCGSASTPADVAKGFFKRIEKNDKSALDLMSSKVVEGIGREKLEKGLEKESEKIKEKGGISSIEVIEEKIEEESADLKLKIVYGNGTEKTDKAKLVKEDGKWKIGISK